MPFLVHEMLLKMPPIWYGAISHDVWRKSRLFVTLQFSPPSTLSLNLVWKIELLWRKGVLKSEVSRLWSSYNMVKGEIDQLLRSCTGNMWVSQRLWEVSGGRCCYHRCTLVLILLLQELLVWGVVPSQDACWNAAL